MRVSLWLCYLQQCLCCAVVLAASGRLLGLPDPGRLRCCLCALLGGLCGVAALLLGGKLRLPLLLAALLTPLLAWPGLTLACLLRAMGCQLLMMWLFSGIVGTGLQHLPAALALCAGVLLLNSLPRWQKRQPNVRYVHMTLHYYGRTASLTALADSGNLLRDDVTGLPVIVLSQAAAKAWLGRSPVLQPLPGMRYLPMRTAAGAACMVILRPDSVQLTIDGHARQVQAMVGFSPDARAAFTALLPYCLLSSEEVHIDDYDV